MSAVVRFPRRHRDSAFRPVGEDGGLVVLPGRSEVKVLNPVANKVFGLLDGDHSLEEIARQVADEFDVAPEQAQRDIQAFLEELEAHGMLEGGGGEASS